MMIKQNKNYYSDIICKIYFKFSQLSEHLLARQLRFVGIVLSHLVFRDSPIFDPETDEFVFIAQTEPNIDPADPEAYEYGGFCETLGMF